MMGNISDAFDLFDASMGHHGDDQIDLPVKPFGVGRTFTVLHNSKVKQVRNRFGGERGSHGKDTDERLSRIQRKLALQAMRASDDDGDFQVARNATRRCGKKVRSWSSSGATEDFGDVKIVTKGGKIVAAFAGHSSGRPTKKPRRSNSFSGQELQGIQEKVEKTGEELIRARRRRRKEARLTRWLPALPPNHHDRIFRGWSFGIGGRRFKKDLSILIDPFTGRRYDELPASQRDEMIRLRLDDLQKQVDALSPDLQAVVRADIPDHIGGLRLVEKLAQRLKALETLVAGLPGDFKGTIVHLSGLGLLAMPAPLAEEATS